LNLSAAILAAGQSLRMGTPKPLLQYGTQTLLQRLSQTLRDAGIVQISVVIKPHSQDVMNEAQRLSLVTLFNDRPELGMAHSAAIALKNCASDWIALLPCDMPYLTPQAVAKCIGALNEHAKVVQPLAAGRNRHPVFLSKDLISSAVSALRAGSSLREFLKTESITPVEFESSLPFEDIDTMREYEESLLLLKLAAG
jgi:CTP:molybdopterin cytidylyltransferase MocA